MLSQWTHFNCGGIAPLATSVGSELLRVTQAVINEGPHRLMVQDDDFIGVEAARSTIADVVGADSDEITFTTQFSTAISIIVEGLSWQPGDEIIVSSEEHPALLIPVLNAIRRRGLTLRRLPIVQSADEILATFQKLLTPRTRLIAMSHVTTDTGIRVPVREITRFAHANGSLVLFDGAHALGQFPLDLHALDCDFYVLVGYKWALGPYPSAALYIRRSLLDHIDVTWTGSRATVEGGTKMDLDDLVWVAGAKRFEYGVRPFAYDTAMATGIRYISDLGIDKIEQHAEQLTACFLAGVKHIPGVRVKSPDDPRAATGIATISLPNMTGLTASNALRDRWKILTRPALRARSIRISLAAFNDERDVELLLNSLTTLAKSQ